MKTPISVFLLLLSMALATGCTKEEKQSDFPPADTTCYLTVKVLNILDSTTVSNATVQTFKAVCDSSDTHYRKGITDGDGTYSTTFSTPAILCVKASLKLDTINPSNQQGYRIGETTTRLKEGQTVTAKVVLLPDTIWQVL